VIVGEEILTPARGLRNCLGHAAVRLAQRRDQSNEESLGPAGTHAADDVHAARHRHKMAGLFRSGSDRKAAYFL
jgi:hypothetical protein